MSRFYYIGSPVPLPCGERGLKFTMKRYGEVAATPEHQQKKEESRRSGMVPISDIVDLSYMNDRLIQVFETEEDAAGIVIRELSQYRVSIRTHFRQPYVYELIPQGGGLEIPHNLPEEAAENFLSTRKCCRLLGQIFHENAVIGEYFEFYTCWAGEEEWPREKKRDRDVDLASFVWEEGLQPQEKQYIRMFCNGLS
ncbi:MAG: hypothetical protein K0Q90_3747 [Paenibacillaceae bacterium]|jgi:hypothetical protein|nr:hypothetical protein [Paenibacillaceae bacterium]